MISCASSLLPPARSGSALVDVRVAAVEWGDSRLRDSCDGPAAGLVDAMVACSGDGMRWPFRIHHKPTISNPLFMAARTRLMLTSQNILR